MISGLLSLLRMEETQPEVVLAQAEALKKRVPILYGILGGNILVVAWVFSSIAPAWLSVYLPGFILGLIAVRFVHWRKLQHTQLTAETARKTIAASMIVGCGLGVMMLAWAYALYPFEDPQATGPLTAQSLMVLFVGLTVIPCMFLMMHVRFASLSLAIIVVPTFSVYLLSFMAQIETAIALNMMLVCGAVLYVALSFSKDFEQLVVSKLALAQMSDKHVEMAFSDALTGLPNRRKWFAELARIADEQDGFAVAVLDLDRFKQINDCHGHLVGDQVLVAVSNFLKNHLPSNACLARMGGDEFAIVIPGVRDAECLLSRCRSLIDDCTAAVHTQIETIRVGVTVGASICEPGSSEAHQEHYMKADYALAHCKHHGRGNALLFSPEHEQSLRREAEVEHALRIADLSDEIYLEFQPVVRADNAEIVSYEALARWQSKVLGWVSPSELFPLAERTNLIHQLSRCVLRKALRVAEEWPESINLKINLSGRDLMSPEQVLQILAIVHSSRVSPHRIMFEITETALVQDLMAIQPALTSFRVMGISVAIDDFGTGFSSLSYIHQMAPDTIKIDRSFVRRLSEDPVALSIVRTIIELCRNIGAQSVAEGVETQQQLNLLRDIGCDEIQGYYFGKPQAADKLVHAKGSLLEDALSYA